MKNPQPRPRVLFLVAFFCAALAFTIFNIKVNLWAFAGSALLIMADQFIEYGFSVMQDQEAEVKEKEIMEAYKSSLEERKAQLKADLEEILKKSRNSNNH